MLENKLSEKNAKDLHTECENEKNCFKCIRCSLEFQNKNELATHKKAEHKKKLNLNCDFCEESFDVSWKLEKTHENSQ